MVTNGERREVAAELRNYDNAYLNIGRYISLKIPCNRLADLIEPEPEKTCKNNDGFCSECGQKLVEYTKKISFDDEQNITMTFAVQPYCCRCGSKVQS